jgi:microcystin-dependent protein
VPYPPTLPPAGRANTTPSFDNHPNDHNTIRQALADIIAELGSNPSGASADLTQLLATVTPIGAVSAYAGNAAPTNWLKCDGASLVRATYPALYGVIGTTYGSNDSLTFSLPDLAGRMVVCLDPSDSSFNARGDTSGWKDAIVGTHTHGMDHEHTVNPAAFNIAAPPAVGGGYGTQGDPTGWPVDLGGGVSGVIYGEAAALRQMSLVTHPGTGFHFSSSPIGWWNRTMTINVPSTATTANTKATTDNAGGTNPGTTVTNRNLPPYFTLNFIIKAL